MNDDSGEVKKIAKKRKKVSINKVIIALLIVGALGFGFWQWRENQKLKTPEGQQQLTQQQINDTITSVKRHMILPEDEQPVIATVNDVEKLKSEQQFYKDATNGDQVLVYQKNQKAVIYSPSRDLIVNVGAVTIDGEAKALQQTSDTTQSNSKPTE